MKKIALLLTIGILCCTGFTQSNVGPVTYSATAFTNQTTAAPTLPFRNLGLSAHWLNYCVTGTVSAFSMDIEGSNDNISWFGISPLATNTSGCGLLEAGGYYNYVRANIITLTGASPVVNGSYSGTSAPTATGGITQIFKTPAPVTYPPATYGVCYPDNTTVCVPFRDPTTNTTVATGAVIYGMTITNTAGTPCTVTMADSTNVGGGETWWIRPVPANTVLDIPLPTIGLQLKLQPTFITGLATGQSTCWVTLFYKGTSNLTAKAGNGGTVTGTVRSYP
jgi:hypothetical protein